jgi:hypothetical protein
MSNRRCIDNVQLKAREIVSRFNDPELEEHVNKLFDIMFPMLFIAPDLWAQSMYFGLNQALDEAGAVASTRALYVITQAYEQVHREL